MLWLILHAATRDRDSRKVHSGNNVVEVLPTGYGKSLCSACLPTTFDSFQSKKSLALP